MVITAIILGAYVLYNNNNDGRFDHNGTSNSQNSPSPPKLFSRNATTNDIIYNGNFDFNISLLNLTINVTGEITPIVDIANLQLTFSFANKNYSTIKTIVRTVGNVSKNINRVISFSLSEFTFSELFAINYVNASVTGGTVSYFA